MSRLDDAVRLLEGDELVAFLTGFPYERARAAPAGTPDRRACPDGLDDPGVGAYREDAWSEVEHLWAVGALDREVYYAVLDARLRAR